jgi:hypothetical protein
MTTVLSTSNKTKLIGPNQELKYCLQVSTRDPTTKATTSVLCHNFGQEMDPNTDQEQ